MALQWQHCLAVFLALCFPALASGICQQPIKCSSIEKLKDEKLLCTDDTNCETGFSCCENDCYAHKICEREIVEPIQNNNTLDYRNFEEERPGYCPVTTCKRMRKANLKYECTSDKNCYKDYKCCENQCYPHKVCVKPDVKSSSPKYDVEIINICPPKGDCKQLYKSEDTVNVKCFGNDNCESGQSCCEDCRYGHRICKPHWQVKVPSNSTKISKAEPLIKKPDYSKCPCENAESECDLLPILKISRVFECSRQKKCPLGQTCCPSRCFKHNICKHKVELEYENCPLPEEKCTQKHSKKRFLQLKCESNQDCNPYNICCFNTCAQFKICTSAFNIDEINAQMKNNCSHVFGVEKLS